MRNRYEGKCYKCSKTVKPNEGHFERHDGGWRVKHVFCAALLPKARKPKVFEEIRGNHPILDIVPQEDIQPKAERKQTSLFG
jgi:hypothetical protein